MGMKSVTMVVGLWSYFAAPDLASVTYLGENAFSSDSNIIGCSQGGVSVLRSGVQVSFGAYRHQLYHFSFLICRRILWRFWHYADVEDSELGLLLTSSDNHPLQ